MSVTRVNLETESIYTNILGCPHGRPIQTKSRERYSPSAVACGECGPWALTDSSALLTLMLLFILDLFLRVTLHWTFPMPVGPENPHS